MMSGTDSVRYRRDIDGLRCLAVLPVVLGHAGLPGFSGGFVGVDIFFVISGYLITGILVKEISTSTFSIAHFYERRVRRILPALFAVLAVCIAFGWFSLPPDRYESLSKSALATLFFISNIWFWRKTGDYFGPSAELEPLLHTWSLAVEEQFYIVFPLFLWLVAARGRVAMIATILFVSLASLSLSIWATAAEPVANFFLTPTRVWELGLGALLALGSFPATQSKFMVETVATLGVVMIVASVVLFSSATPFPGLAALPPCLGAVAIIWAGSQRASAVGRLLSLPIIVWFGLISYSLYLWHWPVLVAVRMLNRSIEIPPGLAAIAIALSVVLAFASWRFIERPFRKHGGDGALTTRAVVSYSAAGATVLTAVASAIVLTHGFETRVQQDALATYRAAIERTDLEKDCTARTPGDGLCLLGNAQASYSDVEFLVWGDSHAAAMLPGFDKWLAQNGMSGVAAVKWACSPLLGLVRVDQGTTHACDDFNDAVIGFLEKHEHIHTIILAARWALTTEGTRAPGEGGHDAVLGLSDKVKAPSAMVGSGNASLATYGLSATVGRLKAMDREVLIVEGVPEIGFSVPQALLNAQFIGQGDIKPPTRADFERRNARANAMIAKLSREFGAQHVSIADFICASDCKIEMDGHPLYRDGDHLSKFAAISLVPMAMDRVFWKK